MSHDQEVPFARPFLQSRGMVEVVIGGSSKWDSFFNIEAKLHKGKRRNETLSEISSRLSQIPSILLNGRM